MRTSLLPCTFLVGKWKKGEYHYEVAVYACVLCGRERVYRYRVMGAPDPALRGYAVVHWHDDACGGHFL